MFKDKTGSEIGLKENDELLLKLNKIFMMIYIKSMIYV